MAVCLENYMGKRLAGVALRTKCQALMQDQCTVKVDTATTTPQQYESG